MAKTKKTKITVGDRAAYQLLRLIHEGNENAIMFALTNKIVCKGITGKCRRVVVSKSEDVIGTLEPSETLFVAIIFSLLSFLGVILTFLGFGIFGLPLVGGILWLSYSIHKKADAGWKNNLKSTINKLIYLKTINSY